MFGALIIILLLASVVALSAGFLMVALRMGKNFHQMGNQTNSTPQDRHRARPNP
jgi:flagellar basal body-associated protein FliL